MSWSKGEALTDPAIREPLTFISEHRFQLRDIPEEITVKLYRPLHSGIIVARRSHHLVVEGLGAVELGECEDETSEGEALHRAANELVCIYNTALEKGLKPSASWLQRDPAF